MTSSPVLVAAPGFLRRNPVASGLLLIGFLTLGLRIPLAWVHLTLRERLVLHKTDVATTTEDWGKSQRLLGPILAVPSTGKTEAEESVTGTEVRRYRESVPTTRTTETLFLPEQLEITGQWVPSERQWGIYPAHAFAAKRHWQDRFGTPNFEVPGVSNAEPHWDQARIGFTVTDLRGIRQAVPLHRAGKVVLMQPGTKLEGFGPGLHAPLALTETGGALNFSRELELNGSTGIAFVPIARQTTVPLTSLWKSPGFFGAFPPLEREIGANVFVAVFALVAAVIFAARRLDPGETFAVTPPEAGTR